MCIDMSIDREVHGYVYHHIVRSLISFWWPMMKVCLDTKNAICVFQAFFHLEKSPQTIQPKYNVVVFFLKKTTF